MEIGEFMKHIREGKAVVFETTKKAECPFCGGEAEAHWTIGTGYPILSRIFTPVGIRIELHCKKCGVIKCAGENTGRGECYIVPNEVVGDSDEHEQL